MQLRIKVPLVIDSVQAELVGPAHLRLAGSVSDDRVQRALAGHLRALHDQVVVQKAPTLTVDVRGLSFVNSSAIRLFVDLVSRAESSGYTLVFDIDASVTWHRLSFAVLESLAPKSVRLRDRARAPGPASA